MLLKPVNPAVAAAKVQKQQSPAACRLNTDKQKTCETRTADCVC